MEPGVCERALSQVRGGAESQDHGCLCVCVFSQHPAGERNLLLGNLR